MFIKYGSKITKSQFNSICNKLYAKTWCFKDVISPHMGKQVFVTVNSLLDTSQRFMSGNHTFNGLDLKDRLHYGYTLALCNPVSNLEELGTDGFDNYHAPIVDENGEPFLRRMWISGKFKFTENNDLKYGDVIGFREVVTSIKHLARLNTITCEYERTFSNSEGVAVIETRKLGYISEKYNDDKKFANSYEGVIDQSTMVKPTIISSFRTSAFCFNSHLIHYDSKYANTEGYPKIVVEGPLLVLLSMQHFWKSNPNIKFDYFDYKITSPVFVDDDIRVCFTKTHDETSNQKWFIWIDHGDGTPICLSGTLKAYS